jgi:hypothetical protein
MGTNPAQRYSDRVSPDSPYYQDAVAEDKRFEKQQRREETVAKIAQFTLPDGRHLSDTNANGHMLRERLEAGMTYENFVDWCNNEKFRSEFSWDKPAPPPLPAETLRANFTEAVNKVRAFSDCDANFNLCLTELGNNFTAQVIQDHFNTGGLAGMVPASTAELARWNQQDIQARQHYLKHTATKEELSQAANQESQARRWTFQEEAIIANMEHQYQKEKHFNYPPLPEFWQGQKFDSARIRSIDFGKDQMKLVVQRFGWFAVECRLRNMRRNEDGTYVKL